MATAFDSIEKRTGVAVPEALRGFFRDFAGREAGALKLLPLVESERLLQNWLLYGFSKDRGYVPIAEDPNGDLYCLACAPQYCGQVFHLAWAGEEEMRFHSLNDFVAAHADRS
ncbi:MAG TPA: SMI1/KNR4 family protein [Tepidisphaeraceae bacterium]|jgi:hypothetical protein|nr:SMI1/KNR4 family protein [Tepidisphaeraceae bacterium]